MKNIFNNYYLKLDKSGQHLISGGKFYTHGIGANGIGGEYIRLDNVIKSAEQTIQSSYKVEKEEDDLLKQWKKDKEHTEYYNKEFIKLEDKIDNLYKSYYEDIHAILTIDEINQIQKEINYNFMSLSFYSRMITLLENKNWREV